jgi:hypothetical protein
MEMRNIFKGIDYKEIYFTRIFHAIIRRLKSIPWTIYFNMPFGFSKLNKENLKYYSNLHKGKRCFIVANGPSLREIDLSLLKNETTIGMNRIYLLEKEQGFMPSYLVVLDIPIQLKQFRAEYEDISIPKFYAWRSQFMFSKKEKINFFYSHFRKDFQPNLLKRIGNVRSVTGVCIQLAFYMGFSEVYLIGKDHNYNISGIGGKTITSDGSEQNHFISGYYKPGQKWKIPSYKEEEFFYKLARESFNADGRVIKDATINGKLDVFEKVDYYSLF